METPQAHWATCKTFQLSRVCIELMWSRDTYRVVAASGEKVGMELSNIILFLLFVIERDLGKPKYDMDRTDPLENNYTPVSSVTNISSGHYPVPTLSSTITVIAPAHHGNNTTESWSEFHEEQLDHNSYGRPPLPKKRCRDYDGKSMDS